MKELKNITEEEVKHICELVGEPYISYLAGVKSWIQFNLVIQILTTSTVHGNSNDSFIQIYNNGMVTLDRNNGDYGGCRKASINAMLITDYLRAQGYTFVN